MYCILYLAALYIVIASERPFQRIRNDYLRFYIVQKTEYVKMPMRLRILSHHIKEKTNKIYHSILSRYNDGQILYYSLSDEDRELIDQIINMHF
jgi:hypothetical protein